MMRIAAMASHGGSILQAVLDAVASGELAAEIVLVISNNSKCPALERARAAGVATLHLSSKTHPDPADLDRAIADALQQAGAEWLLLAGYMKKLGPATLGAFRNRILNTHPALLPKFGGQGFYGTKVHEAVLAAGERESGATVHLVDEVYDAGPILAQVRVPVREIDSVSELEERVKTAERKLIVATLIELAQGQEAAGY